MIHAALRWLAGVAVAIGMLFLSPLSTQAATWLPIKGNVRLANGTPVCAMVLANGQYMFSCDGTGAFNLNVPLDGQGQITLFAFADGFAPYRITAAPAGLPSLVRTVTAAPGSPLISTTRELACAANNWVRITGEVESFGGAPLCAMVLANGQHMFSCGGSQGRYDLTVPADESGHITLFAFADGFQPYSETFIAPECDVRTATIDGVYLEYGIADLIHQFPGGSATFCTLFVTGTNTTARDKYCGVEIDTYDTSGRFVFTTGASVTLAPGISDTGYGHATPGGERCDHVGRWKLHDGFNYIINGSEPWCVNGVGF